jgi:hypothetical protein
LNRANEATTLQNAVVEYTMKQYMNPSLNNLLALWIYKEKGESDTADALIQKINESDYSNHLVQCWVIAAYKNETFTTELLETDMEGNNYLVIAKKIAELSNH